MGSSIKQTWGMFSPRVIIALFLGFGLGLLVFRPNARYTEGTAMSMAASPSALSTHSAKAWQPMQVSRASQKQLLPLRHLERTSQSVANGNRLSGLRGGAMRAVPEVGQIAAAGKIFDFDATLPIMIAQLFPLEKFLDKAWLQPLAKVIEERNEKVKSRVAA